MRLWQDHKKEIDYLKILQAKTKDLHQQEKENA